jgi:hypothetical protein
LLTPVLTVRVVDAGGPGVRATLAGEKLHAAFAGSPEQLKVNVPENPAADTMLRGVATD